MGLFVYLQNNVAFSLDEVVTSPTAVESILTSHLQHREPKNTVSACTTCTFLFITGLVFASAELDSVWIRAASDVVSVDLDVMTIVTSHPAGRGSEDLEDSKKGIHMTHKSFATLLLVTVLASMTS